MLACLIRLLGGEVLVRLGVKLEAIVVLDVCIKIYMGVSIVDAFK